MTVWFDVTSLYSWNRPVTGVTRVELECARAFLTGSDHPVQFVQFEPRSQKFRACDEVQLRERLAFLESLEGRPSGKLRPLLKKFLALLPDRMQTILLGILLGPRRFVESLRKPLLGYPEDPGLNALQSGDCLISVGFDLASEQFRALASLRQRIDLRVLTFCHDLIPWVRPDLTLDRVTRPFVRYLDDMVRVSDHVICNSACTAKDLRKYLDQGAERPSISVIRLGSRLGQKRDVSPSAAISSILDHPFILYVSTIERRKNHEILLDAYLWLQSQGKTDLPRLVLVGMRGWGADRFFQRLDTDLDVARYFTLLHHLSDNDLSILYQKALFTVYPSLYEGWGLPVAESLAYGKFCIASNAASVPEVGGDLVHYCSPEDASSWGLAIDQYASDPEVLAAGEEKILRDYKPPQWRETVDQIMQFAKPPREVSP